MIDIEIALVNRCLDGETSAHRELVEMFQGLVFGLCFRMLTHREDAEDVAQDVFLRVFRSLGRWDQKRPLKPWITTIAVNRCRTAIDQRRRRPSHVEYVGDLATESEKTAEGDVAEEVQQALQHLKDEHRECFVLFYQQELSLAEIGDILDRPTGTIKTWLHRARNQLAEHLKRRGVSIDANCELRTA